MSSLELDKVKPKAKIHIGEMLKREGRSQKWLADMTGATPQQVYLWCNKGSMPSVPFILMIMKHTGWKFEEMFELEEE